MKALGAILATVGALGLATAAHANVIDFNLPSGVPTLGSSYSQDGFTITNSNSAGSSYGNWVAYGYNSYNADDTADIFTNMSSTSNTITQDNGNPFSFQSIGLAVVYNDRSGGDVQFTFNYAAGGSTSQTVTLASGILGLQNFVFSQSGLSSVVFTPTTTYGPFIQFDDVGVNGTGAVPEPATWAMMLVGLGVVGSMARRRQNVSVSFA